MSLPARVYSVQEIRNVANSNGIPLKDICRFYLNADTNEPNAHGIYYEHKVKKWIVYKNKANSVRTVLYAGTYEKEAAQVLWEAFLNEVRKRPQIAATLLDTDPSKDPLNMYPNNYSGYNEVKKAGKKIGKAIGIGVLGLVGIGIWAGAHELKDGYYYDEFNDVVYYYLDEEWYYYSGHNWKISHESYDKDWEYMGTKYGKTLDEIEDMDGHFFGNFEYSKYYLNWYLDEFNP